MEINNPDFWRELGIEPIIINPDDDQSIAEGLEAITEAIQEDTNTESDD